MAGPLDDFVTYVYLHELGHSYGLDHVPVTVDCPVMIGDSAQFDEGSCLHQGTHPKPDDFLGVYELYKTETGPC